MIKLRGSFFPTVDVGLWESVASSTSDVRAGALVENKFGALLPQKTLLVERLLPTPSL